MTNVRSLLFAISGLVLAASAPALADSAKSPTVVELFTSQGCYSCPPAERFLGELASRPDIVALEFHVDYWDELVYGSAGKWKDVFSSRAYTLRQYRYNKQIRRRGNVYTPQMVIGGRLEAVGSRRGAVRAALRKARADRSPMVGVEVSGGSSSAMTVTVDGKANDKASIWLVTFLLEATTRVKAGENKGKSLKSHNIVTKLRKIGAWSGDRETIELDDVKLADGEGCAVLVQKGQAGPILGAAYCPRASS